MDLVQIVKGFEDEQIDTAGKQAFRLLGERLFGLFHGGLAPGFEADAERADGARDEHLVAGDLARDLDALEVHGLDLVGKAVRRQLESVRAEGVGLDDHRPGVDVFAMHLLNEGGVREIQLVVDLVEVDAFGIQHRAHGAVEDDGMFFVKRAKIRKRHVRSSKKGVSY
ncbi:MAG: hypothetical protein BWY66_01596 [bacterium ADurb.Bin374]|nr:MAG: hypothetical protein BWY66_01596 [bacterium ADurb.Bin374]